MDETLVHMFDIGTPFHSLVEQRKLCGCYPIVTHFSGLTGDDRVIASSMWGLTRPNLHPFLEFCNSQFKQVIIWSAGTKTYVTDVIATVYNRIKPPKRVFTRKDCKKTLNGLTKPIEYLASNNPELGLDLTNTLIIDDQDYNLRPNPHNGIRIPLFEPDLEDEEDIIISECQKDTALLDILYWMWANDAPNAKDVRKLNKDHISK